MSIWEAWAPHLAREGVPAPYGATSRVFFANVLTSSPSNAGEQAKAVNLIRLYVTDTIRESTLQPYTAGATQEEQMPQSSSRRGRENVEDTHATGASLRRTEMGAPIVEDTPRLIQKCSQPRKPINLHRSNSRRKHASHSSHNPCSQSRSSLS